MMRYVIEIQLNLSALPMSPDDDVEGTAQLKLSAGTLLSEAYPVFKSLGAANMFKPEISYMRLVLMGEDDKATAVLAFMSREQSW